MLIDINTSLGHWPFMRFAQNSAGELSDHLEAEGIGRALVSSIDTALYPDPHEYNLELAEAMAPHANLRALVTIDPTLAHWRECLDTYRQRGLLNAVRIVPNYHRYQLASPFVDELARTLAASSGVLFVQMRLEDERSHYPLMQVQGVSVPLLVAFARRHPQLRVVCLCAYRAEAIQLVRETRNVFVDIAFVEYLDTLGELLRHIPVDRVLFGSHTPFLYTRASIMKLHSALIDDEQREAIGAGNAARLLGVA